MANVLETKKKPMVAAIVVSMLGAWAHNVLEDIPTLSGETMAALIPSIALNGWWWAAPSRASWWATAIWIVLLNTVVGAILSVLPLGLFPFAPEQSVGHYLAHLLFLVTQLPAIALLVRTRPALLATTP